MKLLSLVLLFLSSTTLYAKPAYIATVMSVLPSEAPLVTCQICHGGPGLNPFGRDFMKIKKEMGDHFDKTFWDKLKTLDSDDDKVSNEEELLKGKNPGDKRK